ncbi:hypothetical protein ACOSP7_026175 [Xanthoceras sorbifolium]
MEFDRDGYPPSDPNSSTVTTTTTPSSSPPDFAANFSSMLYHYSKAVSLSTEQRLNQARTVLEHQQLCDHYDLCLSRLEDFTREIETLRRENADLRLANAALLEVLTNSFNYPNREISSGGFNPKSVMENANILGRDVKANQTNTYSDLIHRRVESRAAEMEIYNQGMWKTELCNKWEQTSTCPYAENCQFAHGITELQPVIRHPKYKTQVCRMVLYGDKCPYGHRCHFRHSLTQQERLLLQR